MDPSMPESNLIDNLEAALGRLFDRSTRDPEDLEAALGRLIDRLARDPEVRRDLLTLARFLAARLERRAEADGIAPPGETPGPAEAPPPDESAGPPRPAET